jgi:hypothetical protein
MAGDDIAYRGGFVRSIGNGAHGGSGSQQAHIDERS